MAPIIVIVSDTHRHGNYAAYVAGRCVVRSSRTPFLTAARVLLDEGSDPEAIVIMRRADDGHDCLIASISEAAALTVDERHRPIFVPLRLWQHSPEGSPPSDQIAVEVAAPISDELMRPTAARLAA